MVTVVILASGPSLTDEDVEYVRKARLDGRLDYVLAVSDVGLLKAPWADALCSHDSSWWHAHKYAIDFKGQKFSARGVARTRHFDMKKIGMIGGSNSGLFAMFIARDIFKATGIILLGFDMHRRNGQHFFGPHTATYNNRALKNTKDTDFIRHKKQFDKFRGCDVFNATPGSDLKRFPMVKLTDIV